MPLTYLEMGINALCDFTNPMGSVLECYPSSTISTQKSNKYKLEDTIQDKVMLSLHSYLRDAILLTSPLLN